MQKGRVYECTHHVPRVDGTTRVYVEKRQAKAGKYRLKLTPAEAEAALQAVLDGTPVEDAARAWNVPMPSFMKIVFELLLARYKSATLRIGDGSPGPGDPESPGRREHRREPRQRSEPPGILILCGGGRRPSQDSPRGGERASQDSPRGGERPSQDSPRGGERRPSQDSPRGGERRPSQDSSAPRFGCRGLSSSQERSPRTDRDGPAPCGA